MSKKRIGTTLLIATTLVVMTGCAATPGDNASAADSQVISDMKMSDMATERTVMRALFEDPTLSGENIMVNCENGVVTLFGDVESASMSDLAESMVRDISGVNNLRNSISIN